MKPPAVNGKIHAVAADPMPPASREIAHPDRAPRAVINCRNMACENRERKTNVQIAP